jgi:hypothetical protein
MSPLNWKRSEGRGERRPPWTENRQKACWEPCLHCFFFETCVYTNASHLPSSPAYATAGFGQRRMESKL